MERPTEKELDSCKHYSINRVGYGLWNEETKTMHEFDLKGNYLESIKLEEGPSDRYRKITYLDPKTGHYTNLHR